MKKKLVFHHISKLVCCGTRTLFNLLDHVYKPTSCKLNATKNVLRTSSYGLVPVRVLTSISQPVP